MKNSRGLAWDTASSNPDVFIKDPDITSTTVENRHNYCSFGENGTTVSVNAHGHIMQICQYVGVGSSGFFCVDLEDYPGPYWVQDRMEDLMRLSTIPDQGLGLDLIEWTGLRHRPDLGFMYDRWPRYVFSKRPSLGKIGRMFVKSKESNATSPRNSARIDSTRTVHPPDITSESNQATGQESTTVKGLSPLLAIQYYCFQGTVLQSYFLRPDKNRFPGCGAKLEKLRLGRNLCIRTLDFVERHPFNSHMSQPVDRFVIGKCHMFVTRSIPDEIIHQKVTIPPELKPACPMFVALEITPFVNNEHVEIDNEFCVTINSDDTENGLEITIAYKLRLLSQIQLQSLRDVGAGERAARPENAEQGDRKDEALIIPTTSAVKHLLTETTDANDESMATRQSMVANLYDLAPDCQGADSSPGTESLLTRPEESTGELINEPTDEPVTIEIPKPESSPPPGAEEMIRGDVFVESSVASAGKATAVDITRRCINIRNKLLGETTTAVYKMRDVFSDDLSDDHVKYQRIAFSNDSSLDYVFRRNLEHILSVCSIPIGLERVAVTCGDVSGHRVGPRASL